MSDRTAPTHQNVIRLDIRMNNAAFAHKRKRQEHLVRVCSDSTHVEADVFAEALQNVSQVHTTISAVVI
jgi:hypothetical protein